MPLQSQVRYLWMGRLPDAIIKFRPDRLHTTKNTC